jgi:16S rRNA processing protein RimM
VKSDPTHLILVGRIGSPFGIKGWVKIHSFTDPLTQLFSYHPMKLVRGTLEESIAFSDYKLQNKTLIAKWDTCQDPETARLYANGDLFIERSQLAKLPPGEYYWAELIDLEVITKEGVQLGRITELFSTGANDVVVVEETVNNALNDPSPPSDSRPKKRLLPYIPQVILTIDLKNKLMTVDWDPDF